MAFEILGLLVYSCSASTLLFSASVQTPSILVSQAFRGDGWFILFGRSFGLEKMVQWNALTVEIDEMELGQVTDMVSWSLDHSHQFIPKALYLKLSQLVSAVHFRDVWSVALPLKIKIFVWQMIRNRLPSSDQIMKRHRPSDGRCALCGQENTSHIFFSCHLARFMWIGVRELLGCEWDPACFADFFTILL